jgi:transposase
MHQYVGLDVSLKETSIRVIDEAGKIVWRGRRDSTPEAIAEAIEKHARHAVRIGLESGQLSTWLYHGLKERGLPVICIDARHARAALSLKVNKTDDNDAEGIAQIMRVGWYREVTVKGLDCQAVRTLLVARAQLVSQITTLKNCVRGILKTFGLIVRKRLRSQFSQHVREAIRANPVLAAIVEPMLRVLETTRDQLRIYDRAVIRRARGDETARQLMSVPGVGAVVVLAYMTGVEDPVRFRRSSSVRDDAGTLSVRRGRSSRQSVQVRGQHGPRASVRSGQGSAQPVGAALRVANVGTSARRAHWRQEGHHGRRAQARCSPASDVVQQHYVPVAHWSAGRMTWSFN